jgi:hypothetical protein
MPFLFLPAGESGLFPAMKSRIHGRNFNLLADSTGRLNGMQIMAAIPAITGNKLYYFVRAGARRQGATLVTALTARLLPAF